MNKRVHQKFIQSEVYCYKFACKISVVQPRNRYVRWSNPPEIDISFFNCENKYMVLLKFYLQFSVLHRMKGEALNGK